MWSRPGSPFKKFLDGAVPPQTAKIFLHVTTRGTGCRDRVRAVRRVLAAVFALVLALASTAEAKKEVPQVLCESCRATLTELRTMVDKTAKKQGRENAVTDAMEAICEDMYNFRTYAYPPPQMQKGCRTIMDRHEEDIETALWRGDENLVEFICGRPKGACPRGGHVGRGYEQQADGDRQGLRRRRVVTIAFVFFRFQLLITSSTAL